MVVLGLTCFRTTVSRVLDDLSETISRKICGCGSLAWTRILSGRWTPPTTIMPFFFLPLWYFLCPNIASSISTVLPSPPMQDLSLFMDLSQNDLQISYHLHAVFVVVCALSAAVWSLSPHQKQCKSWTICLIISLLSSKIVPWRAE